MTDSPRGCAECGASIEPTGRRGRPRRYCTECMPASLTAAEYGARWRELNRDRVLDYRAALSQAQVERRRRDAAEAWRAHEERMGRRAA